MISISKGKCIYDLFRLNKELIHPPKATTPTATNFHAAAKKAAIAAQKPFLVATTAALYHLHDIQNISHQSYIRILLNLI